MATPWSRFPVYNPHKSSVAKRDAEAEPEAEAAEIEEREAGPEPVSTAQRTASLENRSLARRAAPHAKSSACKVVCGRGEDKIADLRCTRIGHSLVWVPANNSHKCSVAKRDAEPEAESAEIEEREAEAEPVPTVQKYSRYGKPFTGQTTCSPCKLQNNVVCDKGGGKP